MKRSIVDPTGFQAMMSGQLGVAAASAKRHRVSASPPSKCLHVRGLPPYCTEQEISMFFSVFGRVEKVFVMIGKAQAFVQMDSVMTAATIVNHFSLVPAILRNKAVYVQYSRHQELTSTSASAAERKSVATPNSILMVSIENVQAPITLDNLVTVFKNYGDVKKIIAFVDKSGQHKTLVQMLSVEAAAAARANLEGRHLFEGCCKLHINFSTHSDLSVSRCGPKSWDFTQKPSMETQMHPAFPLIPLPQTSHAGLYNPTAAPPTYGMQTQPYNPMQAAYGGGMAYNMNPAAAGLPGGIAAAAAAAAAAGMGGVNSGVGGEGRVILVSNLPEDGRITTQNLFNLFGCYGNVMRIKILFKKISTALIQFATPAGAALACRYLNGVAVHGMNIDVRPSKHTQVTLPKEGIQQEAKHLNQDYRNSRLHRFKQSMSSNSKNIFPPGPVLHVSNIMPETKESTLVDGFRLYGVLGFEWLNNSPQKRMAYVKMESTSKAIEAIMALHCLDIDGRTIRISFSKKDPQSVPRVEVGPVGVGGGEVAATVGGPGDPVSGPVSGPAEQSSASVDPSKAEDAQQVSTNPESIPPTVQASTVVADGSSS